ncbi:hypothetical protein JCM10295v2_000787 [Rhodotorula toruloides]
MDQLRPLWGAHEAAFSFQLDHGTSPHLAAINLDATDSDLSSTESSGWDQHEHQQDHFASGFSQDELASPPLLGASTAPSLSVMHEQAPR